MSPLAAGAFTLPGQKLCPCRGVTSACPSHHRVCALRILTIGEYVEVCAEGTGAPVLLRLDDRLLWKHTCPEGDPGGCLSGSPCVTVDGTVLQVLHTPGHRPGAISLYAPGVSTVFAGGTLFAGGPGAAGRSCSDVPTIIGSVRDLLLLLPAATQVRAGHGAGTTTGKEALHFNDWIARSRSQISSASWTGC